jgi:hypothetical protein
MDEPTPAYEPAPTVTKRPVEPIVVMVAATMTGLTLLLMFLTRKHLRARQIAPADSPIRVE